MVQQNSTKKGKTSYPNKCKRASLWIYPKIHKIMVEDRPYLSPTFSLNELSLSVGANRTYVSNALRLHNSSFKEMTIQYRALYIRDLVIKEPYKYDIDDLAILSGFSSKRNMVISMNRFCAEIYTFIKSYITL